MKNYFFKNNCCGDAQVVLRSEEMLSRTQKFKLKTRGPLLYARVHSNPK